jgi:hypothetical protein
MTLTATPSRRRASRRALWLFVAAPLAFASPVAASGCTCTKTDGDAAAGASPAPAPTPTPTVEARSVYPMDAGPSDPLAVRFCDAVLTLPEKRREECCAGARVSAPRTDACVRTLSYAIAQHAVSLAPAELDRCAEAMKAATSGCDWVTPRPASISPACTGIVKGALPDKAPCRSSLECAGGLRCQGLSATDLGVCGAPRAAGGACGVGFDTLAVYTRQDHVDREHPACEGRCERGSCADAIALGAECKTDAQCGKNLCVAGKCGSSALPALGAACPAGVCAPGAGCVNAVCVAPKAEGAACSSRAECRGDCVPGDAGTAGTCAMRCPAAGLPRRGIPRRAPTLPKR